MYIQQYILPIIGLILLNVQLSSKSMNSEPIPTLSDFLLTGEVTDGGMTFTLTGTAKVEGRKGGRMKIASGAIAVKSVPEKVRYSIELQEDAYYLNFPSRGTFPVTFTFQSKVSEASGWKTTNFKILNAPLRKVRIEKLPPDVKIELPGASTPLRENDAFDSFLAPGEDFTLRWKGAAPEKESKLFYSAEGICEASTAAGLLRQTHLLNLTVMQGEMKTLLFDLVGTGEVTRVEGEDILSWKILPPVVQGGNRGLEVQLNQSKLKDYSLLVHTQSPLGVFPLEFEPMRIVPKEAVRYGGHVRITNEGAVRLEVLSAIGLSQLSPDLFPVDQRILANRKRGAAPTQGSQSFAYRFSGGEYTLKLQADNILPEITLSEILSVHIGDNDTVLSSELELDIREAPLREFNILIPTDYSVSKLEAESLSDYFVTPDPLHPGKSKLRLVFSSPLSGRQLLGLKLEKNLSLKDQDWTVPRIEPLEVKSVRGYVGITATEGLRLSSTQTQSLTEVATAFFPKKLSGLQLAYRIKDENWELTLNAERLDLTIQADSLHLFSIGEGIAYGSTIMNFFIVGAPVSEFSFSAPESYGNVEFIGQEVRNWKREGNTYKVLLHTSQSGAYTLLATYDSRFNPHGETLDFTGLAPLGTQSEQGTLIITSEHYYRQPAPDLEKLSPSLIELEHEEIPAEYRLLYDAPILSSYQFTGRPFEANLQIKPYTQSLTVEQVIDYAKLETQISTKSEILTNHSYLLKSKGATHLPLQLEANTKLWNAMVNGKKVTPISGNNATLLPLPQNADPNTLINVELKLATPGSGKEELFVSTPAVDAPVLLTDWSFTAEPGHRLDFIEGNVQPLNVVVETNGFTWLKEIINLKNDRRPLVYIGAALVCALVSIVLIQLARKTGKTWKELPVQGLGFLSITLCGVAIILAIQLADLIPDKMPTPTVDDSGLHFRAPIQLAGAQLNVNLRNVEVEEEVAAVVSSSLLPTILGGVVWLCGVPLLFMKGLRSFLGSLLTSGGWILLLFGLLLKPDGEQYFSATLTAFLLIHIGLPLAIHLYKIPRGSSETVPASSSIPGAALFVLCLFLMPESSEAKIKLFGGKETTEEAVAEKAPSSPKSESPPVAPPPKPVEIPVETKVESVSHKIKIDGNRANIIYGVKWNASTGQKLLLVEQPAVVTGGNWDKKYFRLDQITRKGVSTYVLHCIKAQETDLVIHYQQPVNAGKESWQSLKLPDVSGLLNNVEVEILDSDLLVECPQAVSLVTKENKQNEVTTSMATLMNAAGAVFSWRPRSRDILTEDTIYYGELDHLYTPTAGIVEGLHNIRIRPAQGQVRTMSVEVPGSLTITDVSADQMQGWRFDPDTRLLELHFEPGFSQPFQLQIHSQVAAKPLPYSQEVSPITLKDAAGQVGLVGIATGAEVQLGDVTTERLSPINLEDFPKTLIQQASQGKELTLRRSFRYSDREAKLTLNALPVKPDIRVNTQDTLSIGEDRVVLASQIDVNISRAGIFKLTFELPDGMDVETLSGPSLSHWTELKTNDGRSLTLHLRGKTIGQTSFHISLAGTGITSGEDLWQAPRLLIREASKQVGHLQVVPEQGMRLNVQNREGLTQVDPKKVGIVQKGVLVFRLLQNRWSLQFAIEKVEPWIQASVLQNVQVREGLHDNEINLEYTIENAGIKTLQFQLPEEAVGVRFRSPAMADAYKPENGQPGQWEVKLTRRFIGKLQVQLSYQILLKEEEELPPEIQGILLENINLQRGFLTLKTGSRMEIQLTELPAALKATEWQSIPRNLKRGISDENIHYTFRVLESQYTLPLKVIRHKVENVLPARVQSINLSSVLSEAGILLTEVVIQIQPGNKRYLGMDLPGNAKFWSAFVNKKSVWPWNENDQILIPLEEANLDGSPSEIKFLYTQEVPEMNKTEVESLLIGPTFDLPLESISWQVHLPEYWELTETVGSTLELVETEEPQLVTFSINEYLQREAHLREEQYKEAETLLNISNDLLAKGEQRRARKALQSAWSLSQADKDFNEDARVQLQNLKTQQALIGLANRRNYYLNDNLGQLDGSPSVSQAPLPYLGQNKARYTQQEAQQVLNQNTDEVNKGLEQLATCLIGHQDAAMANPEAIRANLPKQGQVLKFTRSLLVDTDTDLRIHFKAERPTEKFSFLNVGALLSGFIIFLGLSTISHRNY